MHPDLRRALEGRGIPALYTHQREAADALRMIQRFAAAHADYLGVEPPHEVADLLGELARILALVDQATYNELTDRAMPELVQAIEVRNVGGCTRNELTIHGGALTDENMEKEVAQQIGASLSEQAAKSCYGTTASARSMEARDVVTVTIEYEPDDWKSK